MTSPIQLYKQAYSGLTRHSWYLSVVMLINRSGTMVLPFLTIYCIHELHFTIVQAGTIMALFGAGSICGAFVGGRLTDRIGFYDMQILALFTGGVLFIVLGFERNFTGLAIGSFILSFCNDSFRPANSAAVAHYSSPESKTRSYSLNRLAVNLGWAVGGALGGLLASINYHLLFWVDGCTNMLAALMLLKLIPRSGFVKPVVTKQEKAAGTSAYRDKVYLAFTLMVVLFATCFFQLFSMQPVFYKTQWQFNERLIGTLMALNGILIVVMEMVLVQRLEGKRHALKYITGGVLLVGASFVLLNLSPHTAWWAFVAIVFVTFGEMLAMPFMNSFWIARTGPHNRGEYAALYSMAWSTAQVMAPTIGSQIIMAGGFVLLWWILGGVCLIAATGFIALYWFKYRGETYLTEQDITTQPL